MRMWGVVLAVVLVALGAWYALGERAADEPDAGTSLLEADGHDRPELEGADAAAVQAHRLAEEDKAEARLLARRGTGTGGFLVDRIPEGAFLITGRVVGPDGEPIHRAEAALLGDGNEHDSTYADPDGRFTLWYEAAYAMRLVLTADGCVPHVGPWQRYKPMQHLDVGTIRLVAGRTIAGRILDKNEKGLTTLVRCVPDDDPFPESWEAMHEAGGAFDPSTNTDGEGHFRIEGLPPGRYRVEVVNVFTQDTVVEGIEAGRTDVVIRVPAAKDTSEDKDQEGWLAKLELSPEDRVYARAKPGTPRPEWDSIRIGWFGGIPKHGYSNVMNRDTVTTLLRGPGPVTAVIDDQHSGTAPTLVRNYRRGEAARTVRLAKGETLKGRIRGVDASRLERVFVTALAWLHADGTGAALHSAEAIDVERYWRTAKVQPDGRFEIGGLAPGTVSLSVSGAQVFVTPRHPTVKVGGEPVVLTGREFPQVEVTCTLPEGLTDHTLHWQIQDRSPQGGYLHDDGTVNAYSRKVTWTIRLSEYPGEHALTVSARGRPMLGPVTVPIRAGIQRVHVDLPAPRILHGTVVDTKGRPLPRAYVLLRRDDAPGAFTPVHDGPPGERMAGDPPSTVSRVDGTFELPIPPEGTWRVFATYEGHALDGEPIHAKPGKATVRMRPGYRITGRLLDPKGRDFEGTRTVITAWPEGGGTPIERVVSDGSFFEITALAEGTYTLTAHPAQDIDGYAPMGQARVRSVQAGARGVTLSFGTGQSAKLDLVDEAGMRLQGVQVWLRGPQRHQRIWPLAVGAPYGALTLWPGSYTFEFRVAGKGRHVVPAKLGETVRYVVR